MAPEQHVAVVVNRLHSHAGLAQQIGAVTPPRAPERIVDHLDPRLGDGLQIHQLFQPLQKRRLHVRRLKPAGRSVRADNAPAVAKQIDRRLNLLGHLGQRRRPIVRGELDPVVFRRIV